MRFIFVEFRELKNGDVFRYEDSEFSPLHVKVGNFEHKVGDDSLKVRVPPAYKVAVPATVATGSPGPGGEQERKR